MGAKRIYQCWGHVYLSQCKDRSLPVRAPVVNLGETGRGVSSSPTCSARQIAILAKVEIPSSAWGPESAVVVAKCGEVSNGH